MFGLEVATQSKSSFRISFFMARFQDSSSEFQKFHEIPGFIKEELRGQARRYDNALNINGSLLNFCENNLLPGKITWTKNFSSMLR